MGAEPWWYYVKYEADVEKAFRELQQREFLAGRYYPAMPTLQFPITDQSPSPGRKHDSIEDAMMDAAECGTRTILDMQHLGEDFDVCTIAPLGDDVLEELYGTSRPSREQVESNMGFFEELDRGTGTYFAIYRDDKPTELIFAGYSFD